MTHEIRLLFQTLQRWQTEGKKAVFVSVVALNGTSYRRPGVRMIIGEDGEMVGAVSGGCVENEIRRQAQSVFQSWKAKVITYDGRLRIGCEGIIHLLIEPVVLSDELIANFEQQLIGRQPFSMTTSFRQEVGEYDDLGSAININGKNYPFRPGYEMNGSDNKEIFHQAFEPLFKLYIFGAEHDAAQLSQAAKLLGWDVIIVASADESKSCDYFPGANELITPAYDEISSLAIDRQTAVVLMTHSFNKDVRYLMALNDFRPAYIGLLGSVSRRERVLSMVLDYQPDVPVDFLEQIHGPAGISIGAESASEIAVSILAEILSVTRRQEPVPLRDKIGSIHG
ncbi:XdhC family protein [Mangrovibacterium diazotrophicum]|uniref:Xanthine/CO dehydrogenase XdhC/CoxF family maturation factor n=1 Tax=Mangrovibacterium diazotrophicum TaxID=1261403 RepID=A0A419W3F6_9BACT|nr:XdhC/CoxI family protein [Mangrovibacterium diazotrophicum]RKD90005.1 xanthine/CO dehydrogenase XdhC/CoxF family maturation factor [Mangrovibacterium diazotrophicum]